MKSWICLEKIILLYSITCIVYSKIVKLTKPSKMTNVIISYRLSGVT